VFFDVSPLSPWLFPHNVIDISPNLAMKDTSSTSHIQTPFNLFICLSTQASKMPTAIVTGATGILGKEIVSALGQDSQWTKIHALSRTQKDKYPPSVQHAHIDLTGTASELAKQLKEQDVRGEYLFFAAYLAKDDEGEAADVNGKLSVSFSKTKFGIELIGNRSDVEELPRSIGHQWSPIEKSFVDHRRKTIRRPPRARQVSDGGNRPLDRRPLPPSKLLLRAAAHPLPRCQGERV
jgi:hypothetical protein